MSRRRACSVLGVHRSSVRHRPRRSDDAGLREASRETAEKHRRFGLGRLHVILRRDGHVLNPKRVLGSRAPAVTEAVANARWSVDLMQDQFADGRRFRILNVLDGVTKESLASIVDTSI